MKARHYSLCALAPHGIKVVSKAGEAPLLYRRAHVVHEADVVAQVMDGVQPRAEHLVAFVEMVQVSATVMAASVAITTLLNRTQVALVDGIAQFQRAEAGEKVSIARVARSA